MELGEWGNLLEAKRTVGKSQVSSQELLREKTGVSRTASKGLGNRHRQQAGRPVEGAGATQLINPGQTIPRWVVLEPSNPENKCVLITTQIQRLWV